MNKKKGALILSAFMLLSTTTPAFASTFDAMSGPRAILTSKLLAGIAEKNMTVEDINNALEDVESGAMAYSVTVADTEAMEDMEGGVPYQFKDGDGNIHYISIVPGANLNDVDLKDLQVSVAFEDENGNVQVMEGDNLGALKLIKDGIVKKNK